jgi:surface antigen
MMSSLHRLPWQPLMGLIALFGTITPLPQAARAADTEAPQAMAGEPRGREADPALLADGQRVIDVHPRLDARDEAAALEAVQVALTEVGDGSTYVWYRYGGRLSGQVQPTQSFKDVHGRICRHIVVTLNDPSRQRRAEGIACRLADGIWQLEG